MADAARGAVGRAAGQPPQRAPVPGWTAAAFEETDRVVDDVHSQHDQGGWSQARYQRGVEKEKDDHLAHTAEVAFDAV